MRDTRVVRDGSWLKLFVEYALFLYLSTALFTEMGVRLGWSVAPCIDPRRSCTMKVENLEKKLVSLRQKARDSYEELSSE